MFMKIIKELFVFFAVTTLTLGLEIIIDKGHMSISVKGYYIIATVSIMLVYIGRGIYYLIKKKKIKKLLKIKKDN